MYPMMEREKKIKRNGTRTIAAHCTRKTRRPSVGTRHGRFTRSQVTVYSHGIETRHSGQTTVPIVLHDRKPLYSMSTICQWCTDTQYRLSCVCLRPVLVSPTGVRCTVHLRDDSRTAWKFIQHAVDDAIRIEMRSAYRSLHRAICDCQAPGISQHNANPHCGDVHISSRMLTSTN